MATCGNKKTIGAAAALIKVLLQGQKSAKQLQILLDNHPPVVRQEEEFFAAADGFVDKILTSFSESIHRINNDEPTRRKTSSDDRQPFSSEEEEGSDDNKLCKKRSGSSSTSTNSYKKRKSSEETTRTTVSPTMEDGHSWRKYGQKLILNSNFPRSYFRCSHKHDQGCKATKQVQIMEEKPQLLYQTTYIGFHTCTHILKAPTLFAFSETTTTHLLQQDNNKEQQHDSMSDLSDNVVNSSSLAQPDITMEDHHHLHLSNNCVSDQMYATPFEDVTSSQFDHPDFRIIDDFFFFGSVCDPDAHDFTPHLSI